MKNKNQIKRITKLNPRTFIKRYKFVKLAKVVAVFSGLVILLVSFKLSKSVSTESKEYRSSSFQVINPELSKLKQQLRFQ